LKKVEKKKLSKSLFLNCKKQFIWIMLAPYYENEIHEFIPYDKSREILGAVFKAQAETAKK